MAVNWRPGAIPAFLVQRARTFKAIDMHRLKTGRLGLDRLLEGIEAVLARR